MSFVWDVMFAIIDVPFVILDEYPATTVTVIIIITICLIVTSFLGVMPHK